MTYPQILMFVVPIGIILKLLAMLYARKHTFLYRFCMGSLEILCVCGINICMLVYLGGMLQTFDVGTPILCAVFAGMMAIFVHAINLLEERKYPLSEQQLSELLDK